MMFEQLCLVAEARQRVGSSTRVWVYRNLVKVREAPGPLAGVASAALTTHTRATLVTRRFLFAHLRLTYGTPRRLSPGSRTCARQ